MAEGRGAYIAAFVVIVIIILLLIFFFCSGAGCGSSVLSCLKACRFCATASSDQISLGPCCEAKITNTVAQKTTYTLPDPGADAASFLLSVGDGQTVNGSNLALYAPKNTVIQAAGGTSAVTLNGLSGEITLNNSTGTTVAANTTVEFTVTNSSVKATSLILANVNQYTITPNGIPGVQIASVADGSFVVSLTNGSTATGVVILRVGFLVLP